MSGDFPKNRDVEKLDSAPALDPAPEGRSRGGPAPTCSRSAAAPTRGRGRRAIGAATLPRLALTPFANRGRVEGVRAENPPPPRIESAAVVAELRSRERGKF